MNNADFKKIRSDLGKTQVEMGQLLGISLKAVQSFEQGWRNIPVHVERQMLFLRAMKDRDGSADPCWEKRQCPPESRENCPAWEFQIPHLCWFVNGTICHGEAQRDWRQKMLFCRKCPVFKDLLPPLNRAE